MRDESVGSFTDFASSAAPRLAKALVALLGFEAGHDATWEALGHGWENWEKVSEMSNPVGYLYVIGRNSGIASATFGRWRRRGQPGTGWY